MGDGTLVEFGGLPGTGKSTLARQLAGRTSAVWLRIDEIEGAMRRNGLTPRQTGIAAYSVAHDLAASHLRRGMMVIADAVNPVAEAREGWRQLAAEAGAHHVVIETICCDLVEHQRRIASRISDLPGWTYPEWEQVRESAHEYQSRADARLVLDTTRPIADCALEIDRVLGIGTPTASSALGQIDTIRP
jgi:predicted kinase